MRGAILADVAKDLQDVADGLKSGEMPDVTSGQIDRLLSDMAGLGMKLVQSILIAIIVYFIGKKVIKWLLKIMGLTLEKSSVDPGVARFLHSLVRIAATVVLFIVIAGILGLETSSLVAVVGSAGLAVGLSLQGSLANLAGGVLILITKPFRIGDYIAVGDKEGTVQTIDTFYTRLLTNDNRLIVIPNGSLSNSTVLNVSSEEYRRIDLTVSIGYGDSIPKVRKILLNIAEANEKVCKDEEHKAEVAVSALAESSVDLLYKVWTSREDYWELRSALLEEIKEGFFKAGIEIPYRKLDVSLSGSQEEG